MDRFLNAGLAAGAVVAFIMPTGPANAQSFSGFYLGVGLGAAWGESEFRAIDDVPLFPAFTIPPSTNVPASNGSVASAKGNDTRLIGGTQFGYDWRTSGGVVFGAEADFDGTSLGQHAVAAATAPGGGTNIHNLAQRVHADHFARLKWTSSIRGRIGFVQDRLMIYGTGGVVFGHVNLDTTFLEANSPNIVPANATSTLTARDSGTHTGWTLGAGMEWAFTPAWSAGIEYRYNDLGSRDYDAGYAHADFASMPHIMARMNLTMDQVMVRLNYHIGAH
jgi:outer membrane immunogenic protein